MPWPQIAAQNPRTGKVFPIRSIKRVELSSHKGFTKIIKDAENRLRLFRILALNYDAWKSYINKCLSVDHQDPDNMLRLEQLMLNFLASAYALTEQFNVTFRRKYKSDPKKQNINAEFLKILCKSEWAFAFFQDFRNFAQHQGLPIGNFSRTVSHRSVRLTVGYNSKDLISASRKSGTWTRSKLSTDHGNLDLTKLMRDYYVRLIQDYGKMVASELYPDLIPADEFYTSLKEEVQNTYPGHRLVLVTIHHKSPTDFNIKGSQIPNDVYGELGIIRIYGKI